MVIFKYNLHPCCIEGVDKTLHALQCEELDMDYTFVEDNNEIILSLELIYMDLLCINVILNYII